MKPTMKFTTEIPPEDPFGTEPNYIVINPTNGQIWAPQSSRQIRTEKYGWAARGGYMWTKIEPGMTARLMAEVGADQSVLVGQLKAQLRLCEKRLRTEAVILDEYAQEIQGALE